VSETWVINASPLILLGKVSGLHWLTSLCDRLLIPAGVAAEIQQGPADDPARIWLSEEGVRWIMPCEPVDPVVAAWDLGMGESEVLSVALRLAAVGTVAVIDDGLARRCASALGVPVRGTLGVVLLARKRGLVPAAKPALEKLIQAGFHIRPALVREALALCGEAQENP
jgi:predicted nucleic acid-binding protein